MPSLTLLSCLVQAQAHGGLFLGTVGTNHVASEAWGGGASPPPMLHLSKGLFVPGNGSLVVDLSHSHRKLLREI